MTAALALAAASRRAMAQPTGSARRILVAFAPGGVSDLLWRALATEIQAIEERPWIVENVTGAGGLIASARAARAKPDGLTLVQGVAGLFRSLGGRPNKEGFDPLRDLAPIFSPGHIPLFFLTRAEGSTGDLRSFLAAAKGSGGPVVYASVGIGTANHALVEAIAKRSGVDTLHVPYQGSPAAVNALLSGQVNALMSDLVPVASHIAAGRLVALATTGTTRDDHLPNVPSLQEQGFAGLSFNSWLGLFVPASTGEPKRLELASLVRKAVASQSFQEVMRRGFIRGRALYLSEADSHIRNDVEEFQRLAADLQISLT